MSPENRSVSSPPFAKGELQLHELRKNKRGDLQPIKTSTFQTLHYLPYDINLKEFSRKLRKNSTIGEILLWQKLRAGAMMNHKFNRQKPVGTYVVDFYCKPLSLVIEIDGAYHCEPEQRVADEQRQQRLEEMGLNFLRFSEQQVRKDMDWVLKEIENYISAFLNKKLMPNLLR